MIPTTASLVDCFTDPSWLSEKLGENVKAEWIRIKPATSLVASLRDPETRRILGWVRVLWPNSHKKAQKIQRLANEMQLNVRTIALSDDLMLQTGEIIADAKLTKLLRPLPTEVLGGKILRYNPARRVVFRVGDRVWRVNTAGTPSKQLHECISTAVPTQTRFDDGSNPYLSVVNFVGDSDLEHNPDKSATARVGAALARLHALGDTVPSDLVAPAPNVRKQLRAHVGILESLDSGLAERVAAIKAPTFENSDSVLLHGDFTPDQILYDCASGQLWLSDFDRAHLGPAAFDIGSYLSAIDLELRGVFLDAYAETAELPSEADIRTAQVHAALMRLTEPLRTASPQWRGEIAQRLDRIEEVLR
ncbi:MAG: aminoglycoside phosphotransferase family protein [Corynebacterium sp.]|uniref:phosphotransferase family protein n=1 Tax=Corynebacterium sp. TaxID=1720 RepID=UPI0026DB08AE|nr:aminoglycoside phosphotransferase family protein [Corynebacterium sp.]MDO5098326.1 aminoglycoside phosphotransferase family protein [Corynebacterium sp.]